MADKLNFLGLPWPMADVATGRRAEIVAHCVEHEREALRGSI